MITHIGGCDATGKSSICKILSEKLNCNVVHFDKPKDLLDGKQQYFSFLSDKFINKDIICDRFHDGEHIYAPLYRGYESNYLKEFEQELRKYPYLFINTTADLQIIKDRISKRGEDYVKEEHYSVILNAYKRYIQLQSMPYIIVDTSNSMLDNYIETILNYINITKKIFKFGVKNGYENFYYGNMDCNDFIIVKSKEDLDICKQQLIDSNKYENSWITYSEDNDFINYQIKLLNPKNILYFERRF